MNSPRFEAFLAHLYVDDGLRERFLAEPVAVALAAGLNAEEAAALVAIDREGLCAAADSYAAKRRQKGAPDSRHGWFVRLQEASGARWKALARFLHQAACR